MSHDLEIIGEIEYIETIASGGSIRDIMKIRNRYGHGRWRKMKGIVRVRLKSGRISRAEVHWYEAHGIGRKNMKIKKLLEDLRK